MEKRKKIALLQLFKKSGLKKLALGLLVFACAVGIVFYNNSLKTAFSSDVHEIFTNTGTGPNGTIQTWTVPETGRYEIKTWGAEGGSVGARIGGKGAEISGEFRLDQGQELQILVGQQGLSGSWSGGGGGGSFVARKNDNKLLVAVGGGGGAGLNQRGVDGSAGESGTQDSSGRGNPGSDGYGGQGGQGTAYNGGGGSGLIGDGGDGGGSFSGGGGSSFFNGGQGGRAGSFYGRGGGFGGGGGSGLAGGAGGGYSGGAGGYGANIYAGGGGGGSYILSSAENQQKTGGVKTGHGKVEIILLEEPEIPQISVSPDPLDFGDVEINSSKDLDFTVKNIGTGTLSGSVTGLSDPFSCLSGCSYNLSANAEQAVTIRFSPLTADNFNQTANFSGGGGESRQVLGEGTGSGPGPAPVAGNIYDYAWSWGCVGNVDVDKKKCENDEESGIGWISFNGSNYGVGIDADGRFSGYAWSSNIGWITFNETELGGCPAGNCRAEVNLDNGNVSGWARAYRPINPEGQTLGGWTGWISLRGSNYGVKIDLSKTPATFDGYAWGGGGADTNDVEKRKRAVLGWILFDGVWTDYDFGYREPGAENLRIDDEEYCFQSEPQIVLAWDYTGSKPQEAYNIKIYKAGYIDPVIATGWVDKEPGSSSRYTAVLEFDSNYTSWELKVRDEDGAESGWIQGPGFQTKLEHPRPNFDWTRPVVIGEEIHFCSIHKQVRNNGDITIICEWLADQTYCASGCTTWDWDFGDNIGGSSIEENPFYTYDEYKNYKITLIVTDGEGNSCPKERYLFARWLPKWWEIIPF